MEELLKKLLEAEILTEDTKQELESAFTQKLEEASVVARAEAVNSVTAELKESWINEREILIEALDTKVTEALTSELVELREDVNRFRDLEVEYAQKLAESKTEMANTLKSDLLQLTEKMDAFLEIRLGMELEELREDFEVVKKNEFGKKVFEAFASEYKKFMVEDDSTEAKLNETEHQLEDALTALEESEKRLSALERSMKLEKVLAPLSGRTREVMEAILKNVDTPLLEEAYKTYVGRVLKETSAEDVKPSEKEGKVLAEGKVEKKVSGVVKTGDDSERLVTEATKAAGDKTLSAISDAEKLRLRRLAGLV